MADRRFMPSFAELIDRLGIVIQKIVHSDNDELRMAFVQERDDIIHDIDQFILEGMKIDGSMISMACTLILVNCHIWENEAGGRGDGEKKNYEFTHGLNANRAEIKKHIQKKISGRIDEKLNYIKGIWELHL